MTGLESTMRAIDDESALVAAVEGQMGCLSAQLELLGRLRLGAPSLRPAAARALVEVSDGLRELLDRAAQTAAELVEADVSLFRVGGDGQCQGGVVAGGSGHEGLPVSRGCEDRVGASPAAAQDSAAGDVSGALTALIDDRIGLLLTAMLDGGSSS